MQIKKLDSFSAGFTNKTENKNKKPRTQTHPKERSFLDKFETEIINSADLNDTIKVPRTIFKGYLSFMAGTALMTVAAIAKEKHPKFSNSLNISAAALVIYGTYSFVKPYIIKTTNN